MNDLNLDKTNAWQTALINAITDPKELLELLELDSNLLEAAIASAKLFPLKVPRRFVQRMQKGNLHDPLLRQILPLGAELESVPGYTKDPLQESTVNPVPGLLHKYHSRVLLTLTSVCGINCRYCFRRHFPYEDNNPGMAGWSAAFAYIAKDPTISEVILSGGDPLIVNDHTLTLFINRLATIAHVKRLRIHSRMPIVLPERVTPELVRALTMTRLQTILVTHCNHPDEIDDTVKYASRLLSQAGIALLNQSVLLKHVNNDVDVLVALSEKLFAIGIQPYYLHVSDKVAGTAHFDLDHNTARELHWQMTQRLSGYLVPKLVCEQPGMPAKISIGERELFTGQIQHTNL